MSKSNMKQTSPMVEIDFASLGTSTGSLAIQEHAFMGHINIRGNSDAPEFVAAIKKVLKVELPMKANTFVENDGNTLLWLGPDEWLLLTSAEQCANLIEQLKQEFSSLFVSITDISGANTVLELSGKKAQALLLKGCPMDLHQSVFTVGQCAQTVIAKTSMILWQTDTDPVYKLIVRRIFADYLGLWLLDAAREYRD